MKSGSTWSRHRLPRELKLRLWCLSFYLLQREPWAACPQGNVGTGMGSDTEKKAGKCRVPWNRGWQEVESREGRGCMEPGCPGRGQWRVCEGLAEVFEGEAG